MFPLTLSALIAALASVSVLAADHPDLVHDLPSLVTKASFKHYSGYLDSLNGAHLHYWFVESQSANPEKDPVVLWLNGGPGCSSMVGALTELGPFRLNRNGTVTLNPYAWNQHANFIFLESPVGVGYSYTSANWTNLRQDDDTTAHLNFEALRSFFKKFPHLTNNDFYLTGESYAGIYIPTLAVVALENKFPPNFKGAAIGNGYLDRTILGNSVLHFFYNHGMIGTNLWERLVQHCCPTNIDLRHCDMVNNRSLSCQTARTIIETQALVSSINSYNIYDECRHDPKPHHDHPNVTWQYDVMRGLMREAFAPATAPKADGEIPPAGITPPCISHGFVIKYLNTPEVLKALHISDKSFEWTPCRINIGYERKLTSMRTQVKRMVDGGLRVLIYNGDVDSVCNFLGDQWFVDSLGYNTRIDYHAWKVNGQNAGFAKFYDHELTFITVRGSGHMVPEDRPVPALEMFKTFLNATQ